MANGNNNNPTPDQQKLLNQLLKERETLESRSNNTHRDRLKLQIQVNSNLKAYLDLKKEQDKLEKASIIVSNADKEALRALSNELDATTKKLIENADAQDKLNKQTKSLADGIKGLTGVNADFLKKIKISEKGVKQYSEAFTELGKSITNGTRAAIKNLDELNVSLARQTGFTTALRQDVYDLASSHDGLYLSLSESNAVVGALTTGFKMYAAQSDRVRRQTNDLAGRFKVLGVDAAIFSSVLDQLNDGFGLTAPAALAAAAELENLSIRIGQPLSSVVSDFKDLGPQMARFGTDGVRVFTRLNQQARTLGLTTRQAFDISELFDTFEGSADVAGKLNAQLGLQLNSIELMTASSEDRLSILRAEFEMRGMSMKDAGKRQKQMIAEILKTDVLTAEKLLGDPMALRKFQREQTNNADRLEKYTTTMKKFSEAWEQMFINVTPLLNGLIVGLGAVASALNWIVASPFGKFVSYAVVLAGAALSSAKSFAMMGGFFAKLAWFAKTIVIPFLIIKDVLQAMGVMADNKEQALAQGRLAGGLTGATVGAGVGLAGGIFAPITSAAGALFGYGLGREVPEMVQDKTLPSGQPTLIARAGQRPIMTSSMDTVTARKGSSAGSLEKKMDKLSNAVLALASRPVQATMEMDGQKVGTMVLAATSPLA